MKSGEVFSRENKVSENNSDFEALLVIPHVLSSSFEESSVLWEFLH